MGEQDGAPFDTPRIERRDAMTIAGIRERHRRAGFDFAAFPAQRRRMEGHLGGVSGRAGAEVYHLFWEMYADTDAFDYLVGVAVADGARLPDGFTSKRLPARRYAIFRRAGDASSGEASGAIWHEWLPASGHEPAGDPQFLTIPGEDYDAASDKGDLEIWVLLKD